MHSDSLQPKADNQQSSHLPFDSATILVASRISLISCCLFAIYVFLVLRSVIPVKLIDPRWQLSVASGLIEHAAFALIGLALLHLAHYLCPGDWSLEVRTGWAARLAIFASLGFLLLIPLTAFDTWTLYQQTANAQGRSSQKALVRLEKLKAAVNQATTIQDLQYRLKTLQAPPLPAALTGQSLQEVRTGLLKSMDQMQAVVTRNTNQQVPEETIVKLWPNIRMILISFCYAIAFAAAGQRRRSPFNFFDEILMSLSFIPGIPVPSAALQLVGDDDSENNNDIPSDSTN